VIFYIIWNVMMICILVQRASSRVIRYTIMLRKITYITFPSTLMLVIMIMSILKVNLFQLTGVYLLENNIFTFL